MGALDKTVFSVIFGVSAFAFLTIFVGFAAINWNLFWNGMILNWIFAGMDPLTLSSLILFAISFSLCISITKKRRESLLPIGTFVILNFIVIALGFGTAIAISWFALGNFPYYLFLQIISVLLFLCILLFFNQTINIGNNVSIDESYRNSAPTTIPLLRDIGRNKMIRNFFKMLKRNQLDFLFCCGQSTALFERG